jgi:hypothetical protein
VIKPKPGRLQRFGRLIAANSATVTLLAFLLAAVALGITGVYILAGSGWALIAGSVASLFGAAFLRHGMIKR